VEGNDDERGMKYATEKKRHVSFLLTNNARTHNFKIKKKVYGFIMNI
jgi:hypothetical protein